MQPELEDSAVMTCSRCFAYQDKTSETGDCQVFGRPQSRKRDHRWPRVHPGDVPCESFKMTNGERPKAMALDDYPTSAIVTCRPGSEPTKDITVTRGFLLMSIRSALAGSSKEAPLTVDQASRKLHVSPTTIRDAIGQGKLPAKRTRSGFVVDQSDFKAFSEQWKPGRPGRDC
ncbi:MAG: helix-turn-helix domain-containing protein [Deltaproteobacteria bacterium]|nr:helix-turn-helix domain-containing protein [Deltaproteobacteria bacterium]